MLCLAQRGAYRCVLDGWMDGWMIGWMAGWLDGWMAGWLDGWIDGWLDGWMVGWMDGWMIQRLLWAIREEGSREETNCILRPFTVKV